MRRVLRAVTCVVNICGNSSNMSVYSTSAALKGLGMKVHDIIVLIAGVVWILSSILRSYVLGGLHDSRLGGLVALVGMMPSLCSFGLVFLVKPSNTFYGKVLNVLVGLFFIMLGCVFGWSGVREAVGNDG